MELYEKIRSTANDIDTIAKNTGIPREVIEKVKRHIFLEEHILSEGIKKFDPNIDMAKAWDRLINNEYIYSDLLLLQHEFAESFIMEGMQMSYIDAHEIITKIYDWHGYLRN